MPAPLATRTTRTTRTPRAERRPGRGASRHVRPRRAGGAATSLAAAFLLAGCAESLPGEGSAADEVEAITSMSAEEIGERLPDEDFYGVDVAIESDPSDPFRGLCLDAELPEPGDAESVVRFVDGTTSDELGGTSFLTDETIYVFADPGAAADYQTDAVEASGGCPEEEDSVDGGTTYTYAYETGEISAPGWHGHQIEVRTNVDDGSPVDNAEIRVIAQRGNAVAYVSWLVHDVDDVESAIPQINDLVDDYLVSAGGA